MFKVLAGVHKHEVETEFSSVCDCGAVFAEPLQEELVIQTKHVGQVLTAVEVQ